MPGRVPGPLCATTAERIDAGFERRGFSAAALSVCGKRHAARLTLGMASGADDSDLVKAKISRFWALP